MGNNILNDRIRKCHGSGLLSSATNTALSPELLIPIREFAEFKASHAVLALPGRCCFLVSPSLVRSAAVASPGLLVLGPLCLRVSSFLPVNELSFALTVHWVIFCR